MSQETFNQVTIFLAAALGALLALDLRTRLVPSQSTTWWALFVADYALMAVAATSVVRLVL